MREQLKLEKEAQTMMRSLLVVPWILVTLMLSMTSEASAADNVHFGALGGGNFSNITIQPKTAFDPSTTSRMNLGGFVEFGLSRNIFLEARGMYVQKGADARGRGMETGFSAEAMANYVTFPVLLKVKHISELWRPYLVVGPEVGYNTSAKAVVRGPAGTLEDPDFDEGVRSWDFAVCLGGGVEIPAGRVSLLAEGLYSIGLRNIAVDVPGGNVTDVKTRTFLANFGIRF
jgi:hypothetical protein